MVFLPLCKLICLKPFSVLRKNKQIGKLPVNCSRNVDVKTVLSVKALGFLAMWWLHMSSKQGRNMGPNTFLVIKVYLKNFLNDQWMDFLVQTDHQNH